MSNELSIKVHEIVKALRRSGVADPPWAEGVNVSAV